MNARCELDFDAPLSLVLEVLEDFERYPELLPDFVSARVLAREPKAFEVAFSLRVVRVLSYTLRLVEEPIDDGGVVLRWTLVEGAFRTNDGRWTLRPTRGGQSTHAVYEIALRPGMFIPRTLENSLVRHTLPAMLSAFKKRAEELALAAVTSGPSHAGSGPADA